jgi:hypothetical protein
MNSLIVVIYFRPTADSASSSPATAAAETASATVDAAAIARNVSAAEIPIVTAAVAETRLAVEPSSA